MTDPGTTAAPEPGESAERPSPVDVPGVVDDADVASIVASARELGIELDERETRAWLTAMGETTGDEIVVDTASGTFGHRISMLDFSPRDLARFRRIGEIVELTGPSETTEGALALSGSAAQSKIQSFPGDADYFQRFNIRTPTRQEAGALLAQLMRDKSQAFRRGDGYQFLEAKLGSYPTAGTHLGAPVGAGSPVSWTPAEIDAGELRWTPEGGGETVIRWADAAQDPGWVKMDWVVADPDHRRLSNASNVIDVTWESPEGEIVPLDGYLDAFFQEVYLDAEELPAFAKVVAHVSDDALDDYVETLEGEVRKYLTKSLNYGKAAKRMYNVFRLSGRHLDAAFVRELFDEPATILYQVWSLIGTLDDATQPDSAIPIAAVQAQADSLVVEVTKALEGDAEVEIITALLDLRRVLEGQAPGEARTAEVEGAQARVVNLVNTFFQDKLSARPTIRDYIRGIQDDYSASH